MTELGMSVNVTTMIRLAEWVAYWRTRGDGGLGESPEPPPMFGFTPEQDTLLSLAAFNIAHVMGARERAEA